MKATAIVTLLAGVALATPVENAQAAPAAGNAITINQVVNSAVMEQLKAGQAFCLPGCFDFCVFFKKQKVNLNCYRFRFSFFFFLSLFFFSFFFLFLS
jgi:hypothetical protein